MAILEVGAVTVKVSGPEGAKLEIEEIGGSRHRMFDGSMRSTVRSRKNKWHIVTKLLTTAERDALKAALIATPPVTCSGDVLGGTVSCVPEYHGADQQWTTGQIRHRASFTLYEA